MSVAEIRKFLRPFVEQFGKLPTFWLDQDRRQVPPKERAHFLLSIESWGALFVAEVRTRMVDIGGGDERIVFSVNGYRGFILEVRCESYAQDDDRTAFGFLDTLMTGVRTQPAKDDLIAADVAFKDFGVIGAINVNEAFDQRMRSVGILEMNMIAAICVEEEPNNCWIQKTLVTSKVKSGSVILPVPPNFENLLIDGNDPSTGGP